MQEKWCKYYFPRISKLFKMKFGLNIPWMVLYKSMVFCADQKSKMVVTTGHSRSKRNYTGDKNKDI